MRTFVPNGVTLIPEKAAKVFTGVMFDVYQWEQELFDGSKATFEMLKRPDTVRAMCIKDGKMVVLEQEQPALGFFYDFPSGRHDVETETELEAVQRETKEETGMTFSTWRLIQVEQPHTKIDWLVYTFLATDFATQEEQNLDAGEKIAVTLKTLEEIKKLMKDPKARYLGKDIFEKVDSLNELQDLPDYTNGVDLVSNK